MSFSRSSIIALLLATVFSPLSARADRREFFLALTLEPQFSSFNEPIARGVTSNSLGGGASLALYYGITNALHLGVDIHCALNNNIKYSGATVPLQGGTNSTGVVYDDNTAIGLNGIILYRFDTGPVFAPVVRLEVGVVSLTYKNIQHVPDGQAFPIDFASFSETSIELRGAFLGEYRFNDSFFASFGVAFIGHPSALSPWSISIPLTVGYVW